MKYLKITDSTTLSDLSDMVGTRNVDTILHLNELSRQPNIGSQISRNNQTTISSAQDVDWQRKSTILNTFVKDDDLFEEAALGDQSTWKLLSSKMRFQNTLKLPESITLPDSSQVMGSGVGVAVNVYRKAMEQLGSELTGHMIDPSIFNDYSVMKPVDIGGPVLSPDVFQFFKIPWNTISIYSSLSDTLMDFPVYPEELADQRVANYSEMPELLYQYEPWYLYTSSGPRQNTFTFKFHRDMWTGDHRDGQANKLIRFCEANCYPEYNGSSVNVPYVALYIMGKQYIRGIMKDVSVQWSGPIGLDGFYLYCELAITIIEISSKPLNYTSIREKQLIE